MKLFVMFFTVCFFFLATDASSTAETVSPGEPSTVFTRHTENKLFSVEFRLPAKNLVVGQNRATLLLFDEKQNSVSGAEVRVLPVITAHGESTSLRPFVHEKSDGIYAVENLYIDMEGNWTVKIMIRKDEATDNVSFDFPGVKRRTP